MRLTARFTGLCAFVRNTNGQAVRVVLIDSSNAPPCDEHIPALLVPVSNWDQATNQRQPVEEFFDRDFLEDVVVLPLTSEDLIFPEGEFPLELTSGDLDDPCPVVHRESFEWVPKIRELSGDGTMRDKVLTDGNPEGVAARIRIKSGIFSTLDFRRIGIGSEVKIVKFRYQQADGVVVRRALADEILLADRINPASGRYEILATAFDGTPNASIILRANDDDVVAFKVIDIPLDKIKDPGSADPLEVDECFAEFYRLGNANGSVPEPVDGDFCPGEGGGLSNPKCPCACFDDNNNA